MNQPNKSYIDFLKTVDETYNYYSFDLRYGQTIMNVLYDIWPDKYNELKGSDYDCFYDDGTVKFTLNKLEQEWI